MQRMSTRTKALVPGVIFLLTAPFAVQAAESSHRCAAQADDAQRLACYDSEFGKPRAVVPRPVAPAPAPAATPAPSLAVAQPAVAVAAPVTESMNSETRKRNATARPADVTSSIASLRRLLDGRQQATLANGEVWAQQEPDPRAELRVGDSVIVRAAALGSFMLVTPSGARTRVTRVK
jgi:hypothetical protein